MDQQADENVKEINTFFNVYKHVSDGTSSIFRTHNRSEPESGCDINTRKIQQSGIKYNELHDNIVMKLNLITTWEGMK